MHCYCGWALLKHGAAEKEGDSSRYSEPQSTGLRKATRASVRYSTSHSQVSVVAVVILCILLLNHHQHVVLLLHHHPCPTSTASASSASSPCCPSVKPIRVN